MPHSSEPIDHAVEFTRPYGVSEDHWAAITLHADRLSGAMHSPDYSHVVGSAKELAESVAKVVLASRHDSEGRLDFPQLMKRTTDALTTEVTREAPMKVIGGLRGLIGGLNEMRNDVGTGHGYALTPPVTEIEADLASAAAIMWCRWALARLGEVLQNGVDGLILDLGGGVFYGGTLAARLAELNLATLGAADLERLGRAIAQRGGVSETFVVWNDGVQAAVQYPASYPEAYRRGLIGGLFFDPEGFLRTTPNLAGVAATLLITIGDPSFLPALADRVAGADLSYSMSIGSLAEVASLMRINTGDCCTCR